MQQDFPLASIVVPAYNHENYVAECLESVLAQDYPNIELIVINDGSTDSTGQRIEEFLKKNGQRFRYVSKPNEGLVKTLNAGIRLSFGKIFLRDSLGRHSPSRQRKEKGVVHGREPVP